MVIFNIILYITIGFIVYFGYQTVLHYHKHENVNFLRGLIISTLVLAVLVSLQIYWALPNIIGLFLWLFIMFLFISVAASARYIAANPQDKKKRKELVEEALAFNGLKKNMTNIEKIKHLRYAYRRCFIFER